MAKRLIILLALATIVALPFALRPERPAPQEADDVVTIITPHNEAIRSEFAAGFQRWYRERTGRTVAGDWRVIGGTSDIARFLESEYVASFRNYWTGELGREWSSVVQGAFANHRASESDVAEAKEARTAFLRSEVSCGIDVFFGGGSYDHILQARAGRVVASRIAETHPHWMRDEVIPRMFAGEEYRDAEYRWIGNVVSSYGILYNRDALTRLGIVQPPAQWSDLADPRYFGEVALADPTKSSSIAKAFENLIQQQMQIRTAAGENVTAAAQAGALREGWLAGLKLLQLIGANARYFTDSSQKPPIDVAQGDCAAGICIDFYGRAQAEATATRRGGDGGLGFVTPRGGTVSSVDPIAILRGAPHRESAELFVEFTLTMEGQKLWNFRPQTPGGPERFALRRLPVRRDFYGHSEWQSFRSDPDASPYAEGERLVYRPERTAHLFRELAFVIRIMTLDTHAELTRAWQAINAAPPARRERALAVMQDLSSIGYDRAAGEIKAALRSADKVQELTMARDLGNAFRAQYRAAEAIARGER